VRLPDVNGMPRFLMATRGDTVVPAGLSPLPMSVWRWLEVASGVVRIVSATVEQFVPQMVNLELVGGVSFKKGCYPGQEVVARSQYRGTLKRRGALLSSAVAMSEGQEVFQAADPGQPAGTVALAASLAEGQHLALVEIKRAALGLGGLHLGQADGPPLAACELPYDIPQDEH
jgi:tRNA-modifying protein YgfZ